MIDLCVLFGTKEHRIRASDKHLVYHFSIGTLLSVFVAVLLLLNIKQLMRTDWEYFSILEKGLTFSLYNFITIGIATGVCASVALLYYHFCYDSFKKLLHRQQLLNSEACDHFSVTNMILQDIRGIRNWQMQIKRINLMLRNI